MNKSVGSAIEKIKLQEQDNEAKLKERREHEAVVSALQRAIRETSLLIEKSEQQHAQLIKTVDRLRAEVLIARTRRDAMAAQVVACTKELDELRATSDQGILKVWELRSSLCSTVQGIVDACDIRAILMKPVQPEFTSPVKTYTPVVDDSQLTLIEDRLKTAVERKKRAISERNRLMTEPEAGEEFVRIKNALQYSLDMINKLNN